MENPIRVLFLTLLLFTSSCNQEQKQLDEDESRIEGVWNVTESNGNSPFSDVWQMSPNGSFCELTLINDGDIERVCAGKDSWKLKKGKLTLKIAGEDGIDHPNAQVVKFDVAKEGEDFLITIVKDKTDFGHNAKSQILRLRRR